MRWLSLLAVLLLLAACAEAPPPPQHIMAPLPTPGPQFAVPPPAYNPPPPGPRAGPSLRYRGYAKARHCQIKTRTTVNNAGVKRVAKYRVCPR